LKSVSRALNARHLLRARPRIAPMKRALDHDGFGLRQTGKPNLIDAKNIARDAGATPGSPFLYTALIAIALLAVLAAGGSAFASPTCTKEPQQKWLSEEAMKKKIAELGYNEIKVFKTTTTGCYEIYGHRTDGKRAEVYFNPVDGSITQENVD
jgi:hypothetical protein